MGVRELFEKTSSLSLPCLSLREELFYLYYNRRLIKSQQFFHEFYFFCQNIQPIHHIFAIIANRTARWQRLGGGGVCFLQIRVGFGLAFCAGALYTYDMDMGRKESAYSHAVRGQPGKST